MESGRVGARCAGFCDYAQNDAFAGVAVTLRASRRVQAPTWNPGGWARAALDSATTRRMTLLLGWLSPCAQVAGFRLQHGIRAGGRALAGFCDYAQNDAFAGVAVTLRASRRVQAPTWNPGGWARAALDSATTRRMTLLLGWLSPCAQVAGFRLQHGIRAGGRAE